MNGSMWCVVGVLMFARSAVANDFVVHVNGYIADNGCAVSASSQVMTVGFGTVAAKQFPVADRTWNAKKIIIGLENCGLSARGVKVTFNGEQHPDNGNLLKLTDEAGVATGIGIEFLDVNRVSVPLGVQASQSSIDPAVANQLVFYAQYRSTQAATAGSANAMAIFVLEYE